MNIKYIVVHCADTPNNRDISAAEIHRWHKEPPRKWDGIGYHYVIRRNGKVDNGRPPFWEGAHVRGHNHHSIGICLIGRNQFTDEQLESLKMLTDYLKEEYNGEIVGHRDLDNSKTCPNFDVRRWCETGEIIP